jgi:hypothetical protein
MAAGSGASGQVRGLSSRCGSVVKAPSMPVPGTGSSLGKVAHPHADERKLRARILQLTYALACMTLTIAAIVMARGPVGNGADPGAAR